MLSYSGGLNSKIQHQTNEVIFRNVRSRYKFDNKISILYVLSPKTKTSSHDYVGIYPRGWNNLREFVGFEHPISAPFEEPSLDRCIQFTCVRPHITATLYRDHQFVYVNQFHEVLGTSDFFQFVKDDKETSSSDCVAGYQETNSHDENDSEWQNDNVSASQNIHQHVSDAEYAYNTCYFADNHGNTNQEVILQSNASFGDPDEATNACSTANIQNKLEASKAHFVSEESCYQNSVQESYYKPRRGRPLVKTRDGSYLEYQSVSAEPPSTIQRKYSTYMNNRGIDITQDVPYSQKWLPSETWRYQSNNTSIMQVAPYSGRSDVNRGAIPKQYPKYKVPSDYIYKQQLMRNDLDQAHEQIRDLNTKVDQLQQELQLSYAAQAKLRVVAEIAKAESKNAVSFLNSLMLSLVTQYKTKIVNFDNTVMYVTRELESPGWITRGGSTKTLLCGRPSNVRVISGREKELKAIIGRQEMMIRKLHNELKLASKIIDCANLTNNNMDLEVSERGKDVSSPQYTPCEDEGSPKRICNYSSAKDSTFDLTDINKIIMSMGDGKTNQNSGVKEEDGKLTSKKLDDKLPVDISDSPETSKDLSEGDAFVVQPTYYQNREVVVDDDGSPVSAVNDAGSSLTPYETNNNNYNTKNLNSDGKERKSKCTVCEPALGNVHDNATVESSN